MATTLEQHPEPLPSLPPQRVEGDDAGVNRHPLLLDSLGLYLQCPLSEAPGCFRTLLVRSLELAESNFIPTNWRGFSDHFGLRELRAKSAEELVDMWANKHPYKHEHTLHEVVTYAESKNHRKLLDSFLQALQDHLLPEEDWTENPSSCFQHCHSCIPLTQNSSSSSDDANDSRSSDVPPKHYHGHRRTHSLPKNIEISPHSRHPCGNGVGNSVTNIYMTCSCKNSPFTPSSPLTISSAAAGPWPHPLVTPTSTTLSNDSFCTPQAHTKLQSPVHSIAVSPVHTVTTTSSYHGSSSGSIAISPVHIVTTSSPYHSSCTGSLRTLLSPRAEYTSLPLSSLAADNGQRDHVEIHSQQSEEPITRARRRHSSLSQDPASHNTKRSLLGSTRQTQSSVNLLGSTHGTTLSSPTIPSQDLLAAYPGSEQSDLRERDSQREDKPSREITHGQQEKTMSKSTDHMHEFGHRLFDTAPYNLVQKFYNGSSREILILLLATFFLYNGFRCMLQTMCEDGGFPKIFMRSHSMPGEVVRRLVLLGLRVLTVVVTPLCCCLHISPIASKPRIPSTTFSPEAGVERMMRVHRFFSPHYEVKFIEAEPRQVYQMSETMTKRHINSIWTSIIYVILFATLLSYIGGVQLVAQKFNNTGVCQFVTASLVHVPFLDDNVHILMFLDLILMFAVLLSTNTLKDYYYYENRIAVFAVTVGGEAEQLYHEIRRRWIVLDWYSYLAAVVIFFGTCALASFNQTLIPDPPTRLHPEHLLNWCFWISVLSILPCLGLSSNRLMKKTSIPAFLLIAFLLRAVNVNIDSIPPESLEVFFLLGGAVMVLCLLQSLSSCHFYHYQNTQRSGSLAHFLLCLTLMAILILAVIGALYRETAHLAQFVEW